MVRIKAQQNRELLKPPVEFFTNPVEERFHAERDEKGGLKFVSDGKLDIQKEICSQKCNAGLQNIIKMQTMRYGTIENAIARNEQKKTFADVSGVADSVGEQAEAVAASTAAAQAIAKKYGLSLDQVLALDQDKLITLMTPKSEAPKEENK